MLDLTWDNRTNREVEKLPVTQHLESVLRHLGHAARVNLEILIVGEEEITTLNQQFFGLNRPTDVLSFAAPEEISTNSDFVGSVAICAPIATSQASDAGIADITEIRLLATHGLLHLLGYHHR